MGIRNLSLLKIRSWSNQPEVAHWGAAAGSESVAQGVLASGQEYHTLGPDYYDRRGTDRARCSTLD
jgi:hypothetical protein